MVRKIFYLGLMFGAVLFFPWPLTLTTIIILTVILKSIYAAFIFALFFDWLYGITGHLTIGLIIILAILIITHLSRQFIRFN